MKVRDAMHKGVTWAGPDTTVAELSRMMRQNDVGAIPVGDNDRLIGMVTDRDIVCKGLAQNGFDAQRATAREVMTAGIHCCGENDDLEKAAEHMAQLQVRRLPVIDSNKRMVGMLSLGDISHAAGRDLTAACCQSVTGHHA
ncbi:MAG: CBS domain-containing protein [Hyphomicrobiaceae bacterium]|nr:CBS domain-containing protein [Hyphomicrobiaceae bacterium]